jgi:hypothetical protein
MKKIIMAVAIVCAAVIANAATANWNISATKIYDGTGTETGYSGTGYIFNSGVMTQAALFALIEDGTTIGSSTSGYAATVEISGGTLTATKFGYGEQGGESQSWYLVIVDTDKAYFSSLKSVASPTTDTAKNVVLGSQNNNTATFSGTAPVGTGFQGAGHWSAVPEPTSGLLMLVGLAGLALRRRRA